jgi:hypothetical protein
MVEVFIGFSVSLLKFIQSGCHKRQRSGRFPLTDLFTGREVAGCGGPAGYDPVSSQPVSEIDETRSIGECTPQTEGYTGLSRFLYLIKLTMNPATSAGARRSNNLLLLAESISLLTPDPDHGGFCCIAWSSFSLNIYQKPGNR